VTGPKSPSDESPTAAAAIPIDERSDRLNTKAAGIIGLAVMCSRVLGLARELIFAALFGGGRALDAFTVAFRIPNLLRDLFAEGALSTAFVTTFSKTIARGGDEAAWRLANKVATMTALIRSSGCWLLVSILTRLR
jgi:putative peptidoglycan lipid II flippase